MALADGVAVEGVDPAEEGLVGGEAAVGALPEMAVRGDEAGDDPVIVGVVDGCCVEAGGRVACGYGLEGSVVRDDEIAVEGSALASPPWRRCRRCGR